MSPQTESKARVDPSLLVLNPQLEPYLSSNLWKRLTEGEPKRGVLLNALNRLGSVRYLLSTYLPKHLVQQKLNHPQVGLVQGQSLNGSVLLADVSGFTALSEQLAKQGREGAERLTEMINRYFDRMIDILAWSDGILLKFAGDALLAYFPALEDEQQAGWAVRAGQRMMQAMSDFASIETPAGAVALKMKIGISTGRLAAASVGSSQRMEYVVMGEAISRTMAAESAAQAGQLIVDQNTAALLPPAQCTKLGSGFFSVVQPPAAELSSYEIKAGARRRKSTVSWLASDEELVADMHLAWQQIEALRPFLPAQLAKRIIAGAEQRQLESEFRPTVVLFVNFTGLEALLHQWELDPADSDQGPSVVGVLGEYLNAMQQVVANYDGVITRIDPYQDSSKMLVLFGAPVAHEDDPQRAVHTALEMKARLAKLNDRWGRIWAAHLSESTGPIIQQRIGITQGEAFAGQAGASTRREYTVMGDDVNLSARLMAAAQADQILVSHSVFEAVANHFHLGQLSPIQVKGKSQAIPVYQVENQRSDRLTRRMQSRGALLGRDAQKQWGQAHLVRALAGQGAILSVHGAAGIGKSHLVDALAAEAFVGGAQVFLSECAAYSSTVPYAPWISLFHAMVGILPADDTAARSEKLLEHLAALDLDQDPCAEPLFNLLGLPNIAPPTALRQLDLAQKTQTESPAQDTAKPALFAVLDQKIESKKETGPNLWQLAQKRQKNSRGRTWQRLGERIAAREQRRLFDGIFKVVELMSERSPLVLIFEDAHWMDSWSQTLLDQLAERSQSWPMLALLVKRTEESARVASTEQEISLEPLELDQTTALLTHLVGDSMAPSKLAELAPAVHQQSGGNPLFIKEIVRWLQRTGQTDLDSTESGLRASSTLQELVLSRLDSLSYTQRNTAKAASLIGREFDPSALCTLLTGRAEKESIRDSLTGLIDAQLMLLTQAGIDPQYAFQQTLVRELIYASLPFARRRELHGKIAAELENRHAQNLIQWVELLAHHYRLSQQWIPAARYLLVSGHKARQRYAYSQAAATYSKTLKTLRQVPGDQETSKTGELQVQAHEGQGDIAVLTGDYAGAAAAYTSAHSLLAEQSLEKISDLEARLLLKLALALPTQNQAAEAKNFAQLAQSAHSPNTDLAATATLAWLCWRNDHTDTGKWIDQAHALAKNKQDRWTGRVSALLLDLAGEWGQAQRAYLSLDRPNGAALAACRQGDQHLAQGNITQASPLFAKAAEIWEKERDAHGLALAKYRQAELRWRQSDLGQARANLQEALDLLQECDANRVNQDRQTIQAALDSLDKADHDGNWPRWTWQHYDDALRISILFPPWQLPPLLAPAHSGSA